MHPIIETYSSQFTDEIKEKLLQMYNFIERLVPEASIKISYQMPTFYLNGNLVHFAAQKNHIGFYPGSACIELFKDKISQYKYSKGTIQIPYDQETPWSLLKEIIIYRKDENLRKPKK
jgi:uncharacterized protein YdhG (YjbR/CyaY superfamily)